jgi:hypothetical protein
MILGIYMLGDWQFILQVIWCKLFFLAVDGVKAQLVLPHPLGQLYFGLQALG